MKREAPNMIRRARPDPAAVKRARSIAPLHSEHARVRPDGQIELAGGHSMSPEGALTLADGSMVISPEQVARFGMGDARAGRGELRRLIADAVERMTPIDTRPTEKPASVRLAGVADEAAIYVLLSADIKEYAHLIAPMEPERLRELIEACTRKKGGICGIIDGEDGMPVAISMMHPYQWWWSRQFYYLETTCFVRADCRRSHHATELLLFQKWVSDQMTAKFGYTVYLLCGVLSARRVLAKVAMYKRKFTQVGAAYIHPVPPGGTT